MCSYCVTTQGVSVKQCVANVLLMCCHCVANVFPYCVTTQGVSVKAVVPGSSNPGVIRSSFGGVARNIGLFYHPQYGPLGSGHVTCMYPPPHVTCMYPPPHITCM